MAVSNKGRSIPSQGTLFGDPPETGAAELVAVTRKAGPLSVAQRAFNRLTERIRRSREALAGWEAYASRFQSRVAADLYPIEQEVRAIQRDIVKRLDSLLSVTTRPNRLNRNHRDKARGFLLDIIDNLLDDSPDDAELVALFDRYSEFSRADTKQEDLEITEILLNEMFGADATHGHDAQDSDELLDYASRRIAEEAARERARPKRRGTRAPDREEHAVQDASLALREIYRKLASALHPDRETDPGERDRKTALMQRVNQAYQRNDLLELLSLQIETEQIDTAALAELPDARLKHYNQTLLEQVQVLEAQIEQRVAGFRIEFDLRTRTVTPPMVDQALAATIVQARAHRDQLGRDLKRLQDPTQYRSVLDELPDSEGDDFDLNELTALTAMLDATTASPRSSRRKKKRKKKARARRR